MNTPPRKSRCFEVSDLLSNSKSKGEQNLAGLFGNAAELRIFADYLVETHAIDATLGFTERHALIGAAESLDRDYCDVFPAAEYEQTMRRWHPDLSKRVSSAAFRETKRPDILSRNGSAYDVRGKLTSVWRFEY